MTKRIVFTIVISLLLTSFAFASEPAKVSGADVSAKVGEAAVVDVTIQGNPGLAAWFFELEWDSAAMGPVEDQVCVGSAFRSGSFLSIKNSESVLRVIWFSTKDVDEDGVLFSVPFRINAGASGKYPIKVTCSKENTINGDEETVPIAVSDGSITVPVNGIPSSGQGSSAVPQTQQTPYTDVLEKDYFYKPVIWAVKNGITKGTTENTFSPGDVCTRAQAVTFLWRAAGCPEPGSAKNPFRDVSDSAYYRKAVLWAAENGITNGTSRTAFSPDAPVTRAQSVTFLWRSAGCIKAANPIPFSDLAPGAFYSDAVSWAVQYGVTNGVSDTAFGPLLSCTRAQIVTFLYRYYAA